MEPNDQGNLPNFVNEIYEREHKDRRALAQLLEIYTNHHGKFLATRGEMGVHHAANNKTYRTPSFVVSHELKWVANNVLMGSAMPFMTRYRDSETGKLKINESNVEELKQREPDFTRQAALTAYLATDKNRKFGTILAVISPDWIDDPNHENWGADGRALRSAAMFEALDMAGRVGMLSLEGVRIYALDGQHRVMGIKGIQELESDRFALKDKHGDPKKKISREDFLEAFGIELSDLQAVMSERMHIEYVPAVLPGETQEEGSRRIRSVFVAINSTARKPTKGENYLLDETNGYALVARRAGVRHPIFKGKGGSRINWKTSALPEGGEWYTTIEAVKEMAEKYLTAAHLDFVKRWDPPAGFKEAALRPSEEDLSIAEELFNEFLNGVHKLPVFEALERSDKPGKELVKYRAFPESPGAPDAEERGHLLLRPIGQQVLAEAVGQLVGDKEEPMSLKEIFNVIEGLDRNGRFEAHRPSNVWYGVTYNFQKNKMDVTVSNRKLAVSLLKYLIRGGNEAERASLLRQVISLRVVGDNWVPFTGGELIKVIHDAQGEIVIDGFNLPVPRS